MHHKTEKLFYGLSIFILLNALYVMDHGAWNTERVSEFKQEMREEFARALVQTIGDQPFILPELAFIFDSVDNFYEESAAELIALLDPQGADDDIIWVAQRMIAAVYNPQGQVAGEVLDKLEQQSFMTQEPLYNLVP